MAERNKIELLLEAANNTKKSFDEVKKSLDNLDKKTADVSKSMTSKMTDSFNSMKDKAKSVFASIKKNWIAVSASIFAATHTIRKGWNLAFDAAQFEQSRQAFKNIVKAMGGDAEEGFKRIKEASRGLIPESELLLLTNMALTFKIPLEDIPLLLEGARAGAREMGITTTFAFESIIKGIGRARSQWIDNVGILVTVKEANEELAASLGKTVQQLTIEERSLALLEATKRKIVEITERQNLEILTTAERMQQLMVIVDNLKIKIGTGLVVALLAATAGFQTLSASLSEVAALSIDPLVLIEKGLNKLGISTSTFFQDLQGDFNATTDEIMAKARENLAVAKELATGVKREVQKGVEGALSESVGKPSSEKLPPPSTRKELEEQFESIKALKNAKVEVTKETAAENLKVVTDGLNQEVEATRRATAEKSAARRAEVAGTPITSPEVEATRRATAEKAEKQGAGQLQESTIERMKESIRDIGDGAKKIDSNFKDIIERITPEQGVKVVSRRTGGADEVGGSLEVAKIFEEGINAAGEKVGKTTKIIRRSEGGGSGGGESGGGEGAQIALGIASQIKGAAISQAIEEAKERRKQRKERLSQKPQPIIIQVDGKKTQWLNQMSRIMFDGTNRKAKAEGSRILTSAF